jgi:flagellar basal body L-ring protein FlgH
MLRKILACSLLLVLAGCASLGLAPAKSFDERWSYAQAQTIGLRDASTRALDAKLITSGDMEYCIAVADRSTQMLTMARAAHNVGDISTAEGRLLLVSSILTDLETYLTKRAKQ